MSSTREELYARVVANPRSVEARLVYADLLQAEGDPRGEFIALQCRLEETDPIDPAYPGLFARTERLRAEHQERWLEELHDGLASSPSGTLVAARGTRGPRFERGFLADISLEVEELSVLQRLTADCPWDGLTIVQEDTRAPPNSFPGRRVRHLGLQRWERPIDVTPLLDWDLSHLEHLRIDFRGRTGTYRQLVQAPWLLGIETLEATDVGVQALEILLAKPERLPRLRTLRLTGSMLQSRRSLKCLRESETTANLVGLDLAGHRDLAPYVETLAGWSRLVHLRRFTPPRATPLETLCQLFPEPTEALRRLDLRNNRMVAQQPREVWRVSPKLTTLDLANTHAGDEAFARLVHHPHARHLRRLRVAGWSLTDDAIGALVDSPIEGLVALDLSSNRLSDAGAARLAEWAGLRHVVELRLDNNRRMRRATPEALASSTYFEPARVCFANPELPDSVTAALFPGRVTMDTDFVAGLGPL